MHSLLLFTDTMELRIFYRCDKVIDRDTKQLIWQGPSEIQLAILQIDPMDILHSSPKLRFLRRQIFLKLKEEYFAKRLTPPNTCMTMYRCKITYEDEQSWIHGISRVNIEEPSNNRHILVKHDEEGRYGELCMTITLSLQNNIFFQTIV